MSPRKGLRAARVRTGDAPRTDELATVTLPPRSHRPPHGAVVPGTRTWRSLMPILSRLRRRFGEVARIPGGWQSHCPFCGAPMRVLDGRMLRLACAEGCRPLDISIALGIDPLGVIDWQEPT